MTRINLLVPFVAGIIASASAQAEIGPPGAAAPSRDPNAASLLNREYLAATGATVPRPGDSRGPALAPRTIRDRDDHFEN
jgi:hypothetical protein